MLGRSVPYARRPDDDRLTAYDVSEQQAKVKAVGWVAYLGDRRHFTAHVEYKEPGPFSFVSGPKWVDAAEAITWARQHAERSWCGWARIFLPREMSQKRIFRSGHTRQGASPRPAIRDRTTWHGESRPEPAGFAGMLRPSLNVSRTRFAQIPPRPRSNTRRGRRDTASLLPS